MSKEILWANFEGVLISALAYLIFVKFFTLEKLQGEKSLSTKRIRTGLISIAYFILATFLLVVLSERGTGEPLSVAFKIYFAYLISSTCVFLGWPTLKTLLKNR